MIASVGPSSAEGRLLKGTSDDPSSGPLPLPLEKRLQILQKWQDQETAYTEEIREFILKSGFSRDKQRKVSSIGSSSTEGSLLKGTSDDPSSGPLPLTLEKRLQILQKWQDQETAYTEEIREFILKSGFSRDKQIKVSSVSRSSTEDTDLALVQQQDTESALVQQQDTDSALVQQQEQASSQSACQPLAASLSDETSFSSFDLYSSQDQWCCCNVCDKCILTKNIQSHLESTLHLTNVAAMKGISLEETSDDPSSGPLPLTLEKRDPIKKNLSKLKSAYTNAAAAADDDDYNDEPCFPQECITWLLDREDDSDDVDLIKSKRSPDDKASDAVEITKLGTIPADTILSYSDDVDFIKSKRIPDDEASDAVEFTKFETVPADAILKRLLIQSQHFAEDYGLRFPYESDFIELGNANRHVFQISHRNKVLGTAFLFNQFLPQGQQYLLTAGHVIAGYDGETELQTAGWLSVPASPVGISSTKDVGVLRFKRPLFPRKYPFLRPLSIYLGTETSTHIYVVGCMSGALSEKCPVLPSQDKDDGFIRFQSKLFSEDSFGSPCLVFKDGQYVVKGMLIGREGGTDTPYELIAITFRCVLKRLGI